MIICKIVLCVHTFDHERTNVYLIIYPVFDRYTSNLITFFIKSSFAEQPMFVRNILQSYV